MFIIPIGNMLTRSVDDVLINNVLPQTFEAFESWDKESEPSEAMFEAFYNDLSTADRTDVGKASVRMNYAHPGWRSLIKRTNRKISKMEPPYKEAFLAADDRWLEPDLFRFGASSLLGDIERQLEHYVTGAYSAGYRHSMG